MDQMDTEEISFEGGKKVIFGMGRGGSAQSRFDLRSCGSPQSTHPNTGEWRWEQTNGRNHTSPYLKSTHSSTEESEAAQDSSRLT
jgi:hypothetical protein